MNINTLHKLFLQRLPISKIIKLIYDEHFCLHSIMKETVECRKRNVILKDYKCPSYCLKKKEETVNAAIKNLMNDDALAMDDPEEQNSKLQELGSALILNFWYK